MINKIIVFDYTLMLESPASVTRDVWWQALWELVTDPGKWRDAVTASSILSIDQNKRSLRRRLWFDQKSFDEVIFWSPGEWLSFITLPTADFPGGTLTVTLLQEQGWFLTFSYRRSQQDTLLPDGSRLSDWLSATYRIVDEAYVARLRHHVLLAAAAR